MKTYRVDRNGKLINPIDLLVRLAQLKNEASQEFFINVKVRLCYKLSDDGQSISWGHEEGDDQGIVITDEKGKVSDFHHLGLGEEEFFGHLFQIGGKIDKGIDKNFEFQKVHDGFSDSPDLFNPKTPPKNPPPGDGVPSASTVEKWTKEKIPTYVAPKDTVKFTG